MKGPASCFMFVGFVIIKSFEMDKNICQTCLSKDRRLVSSELLLNLVQEINIFEMNDLGGNVCWECHHMMVKFKKFKLQVRHAQKLFNKHQDLKCLSKLTTKTKIFYDYQYNFSSDPLVNEPSGLRTDKNDVKVLTLNINDKCDHIDENLTGITKSVTVYADMLKTDIVKAESEYVDDDDDEENDDITAEINHDSEIDDERSVTEDKMKNEATEIMDTKPKNKLKKAKVKNKYAKNKKKLTYDSDEEVKKKFTSIVFSEEEMLKNREEKRGQPNFKKIPFKCDSCVLGFTREDTYRIHIEKKHDENIGPFTCDVCQTRFPSKKWVERHCRRHYIRFRCRLCAYETAQRSAALNHCRSKHSADIPHRIHCAHCQFVATTPEELADHNKIQHVLYCEECGEKFKGKNTLRTHKSRIHGVKREFFCDLCSRTFMTKTRLESHMVSHNAQLAKKLAFCSVCNVQYKNIYVYRNHLKNSANHSERAYPCPECNKRFASKVYWTKHYNFYHLQKSQFSCEICNKLFISDWRLKNHKQKHHGLTRSRDHSCNVCGKQFFTLSTLRGHQLTHSEQRSYMCEDCGDTFKQRPALYTHSRLVHKGVKRKK